MQHKTNTQTTQTNETLPADALTVRDDEKTPFANEGAEIFIQCPIGNLIRLRKGLPQMFGEVVDVPAEMKVESGWFTRFTLKGGFWIGDYGKRYWKPADACAV